MVKESTFLYMADISQPVNSDFLKRKKRHSQTPTKKIKRKINFSGEDCHYGSCPQTPGLNLEDYNKKEEEFLKRLQCDNNKILNIQSSTT
ncbi:hypothetical protein PR048_024681 [Dryococelus australis]|uniref:Uncharacterized protein n=1 Tax=Dryococelus australis TaxID=614101 RepID=A0ABQ9GP88_9NEOP|nr:hypothetical protein PR048_024681 [Dryococelus australis]